jgi:hypothetical protein
MEERKFLQELEIRGYSHNTKVVYTNHSHISPNWKDIRIGSDINELGEMLLENTFYRDRTSK